MIETRAGAAQEREAQNLGGNFAKNLEGACRRQPSEKTKDMSRGRFFDSTTELLRSIWCIRGEAEGAEHRYGLRKCHKLCERRVV